MYNVCKSKINCWHTAHLNPVIGSVSTFSPEEFNKLLLGMIKHCKNINFIWKIQAEQLSEPIPNNVLTSEWLPQMELLAHPKTRAFVTHGGKNSIFESIYYAVPMIVLPVGFDQPVNARNVAERNYGMHLHWKGLTVEKLAIAIREIVQNASYRETIAEASQLYREKYRGRRKAVDAIERVFRNGNRFRPPNTELKMSHLFLFDVLLFLYGLLLTFCLLVLVLFSCLCHFCFCRKLDSSVFGFKFKRE